MKDSKTQYDVRDTPATVFATWNALSMGREATEAMRRFKLLAIARCAASSVTCTTGGKESCG